MRGGHGWHVITCGGGEKDSAIINRIMLRYRPIAPKPVDGSSSSGSGKPDGKLGGFSNVRKKRKYVRVKKNIEFRKRRKKTAPSPVDQERKDPTLQFLPQESTDLAPPARGSNGGAGLDSFSNILGNQKVADGGLSFNGGPDRPVLETSVTVESVSDTCGAEITTAALGSTDMERMRNLERDTCPGFVSDGSNQVEWVNESYRRLVGVDGGSRREEVRVRLEVKEKVVPYVRKWGAAGAFTCWVRLQQNTWQKKKLERCSSTTRMVPCDVWRMDFGGLAWRLDVKAALSLAL